MADRLLNVSMAKNGDVLGQTKSYNRFCLRVNNNEFQPKAITHEFFDGTLKIKKLWVVVYTVTNRVPNHSTAKTHDVLGRQRVTTVFFSGLKITNFS